MTRAMLGRLDRLQSRLAPPCQGCAGWPPIGLVADEGGCPEVPASCPVCGRRPGFRCIVVPLPTRPWAADRARRETT